MDDPCILTHYRDKDQDEVNVVVEDFRGRVVGVEVKASATVTAKDFRGLRKLETAAGEDFRGLRKLETAAGEDFQIGMVLYDGERTVPFGDRLFAAPVSSLWA